MWSARRAAGAVGAAAGRGAARRARATPTPPPPPHSYFNEATGGRYVPRAVLMDLGA
jgi:hypothetical protein